MDILNHAIIGKSTDGIKERVGVNCVPAFLFLLCLTFTSCSLFDPHFHTMYEHSTNPIEVKILSHYRNVTISDAGSIRLYGPAAVAFRTALLTDGEFSALIRIDEGALDVYMYSTPRTFDSDKDSALHLRLSNSSVSTRLAGATVLNAPITSVRGEKIPISIATQGRHTSGIVNCVETWQESMNRPSTEWIIIAVEAGSTVQLTNIIRLPFVRREGPAEFATQEY